MIIRHIRLRARWNIVFTLVLAVTSGTAASLYAQPTVTFPTPLGPGIQIPFNSDRALAKRPLITETANRISGGLMTAGLGTPSTATMPYSGWYPRCKARVH